MIQRELISWVMGFYAVNDAAVNCKNVQPSAEATIAANTISTISKGYQANIYIGCKKDGSKETSAHHN